MDCLKTLIGHTHPVLSVAFSPSGQTIASCGGHSIIKLWNINTGLEYQTIYEQACYKITFSLDGKILASCNTLGVVKLWDVSNAQCLATLSTGQLITSVIYSPDGKILACGSHDETVKLWNIIDNRCIQIQTISSVWSLAFSPDGKMLATGNDAETIQLWDLHNCECLKTFKGDKPYEGIKIKGITGLTPPTIANLKALGAVEF